MPMVGMRKFDYTAKGKAAAKAEEKRTGKKMVVKKTSAKPTKKKSTMVRKKGM